MGPLEGIRIIEIGGIGPGPFAGMMLADMGADVIIVERPIQNPMHSKDCNRRGKRSITLDLKDQKDVQTLLKLVSKADVLFEGLRPGVMERLGVSPETCMEINPKLIYARMTGWGQNGPLTHAAGHDINYISLTGALHAIGSKKSKPIIPLNLIGDYGGGSMLLVIGILAALIESSQSGKGQVIDAAMTDGSALMMSLFHTLHAMGLWSTKRGVNMLDSGAHFYNTYATKDQKYISIGAIEPQFYNLLIDMLELDTTEFGSQLDPNQWVHLTAKLEYIFKQKTQKEWCDLLEGSDVCFAPVLDFIEAQSHPHNIARNTYVDIDGVTQPAPAPRFERTPSGIRHGSVKAGEHNNQIRQDWGISL